MSRRSLTLLVVSFLLVALEGCTTRNASGTLVPSTSRSDSPTSTPAVEFSFADTARLLAERKIVLKVLPEGTQGLLSPKAFADHLRLVLKKHSSWRVLSVHLGSLDIPDPPFHISNQPTYVVEVTGPATGNCFEFYLATSGHYQGGACFYPKRS